MYFRDRPLWQLVGVVGCIITGALAVLMVHRKKKGKE
jgi:hypothetical protein